MKLFKTLLMSVIIATSISMTAQAQDIVETAAGNEDFSILVQALQEANLVGALQEEGPFTVFAPSNQAFQELLTALDITADELLSQSNLSEVLLYHVVSGKVMSTDLTDGQMAQTLSGESIQVSLANGVAINDSQVVTADIETTNGVIHVIDKVLIPDGFALDEKPSIVDIALSDENFSILVSALRQADLVEALQAEGEFTVFAPTNAAFEKLLEDLSITASDLLMQPELSKVLLYHVLDQKVLSSDLVNGSTATTLNGSTIAIDTSSGVKINESNVTLADLEASNGVVHVVDQVLVPANFTLNMAVEQDHSIPKTSDPGLALFTMTGLLGLAGYAVSRRLK
jgi:transforming growth factor-beta-induced protein